MRYFLKRPFLAIALCLLALPVTAEGLRVTQAQVIETNASLGPYAKTKVSTVSLAQFPPEVSEQLLTQSWVNGFLLQEYAQAVLDNDQQKLREIFQGRSRDVLVPAGSGSQRLVLKLADGTKVELAGLQDWKLSGYIQDKFWGLFWEKASTTELPGTHSDFPMR